MSHPKPRTLRLSEIPTSVDENQLRQYLNNLECETTSVAENVLALSLAPYIDWLVATVTFRQEPLIFTQCRPHRIMHFELPTQLVGPRETGTILVDCDFYGITPLYHPPGLQEPEFDVIAVSGLSAHAFGSWKSPLQSHVMWLRDFLRLDFPEFRVLTWGYDSNLKDSTTTNSIMNFSRQLLTAVYGARDEHEVKHRRPIIFIGHSLGGLVIKQALVDAAQGNSENDKTILRSCVGLFLFGVPNRGLNNENLLSLVKDKRRAPFVHDLMEGSQLLHALYVAFQRSYKGSLKSCFVVSFFETQDTKTVEETPDGNWRRSGKSVRMVTQESATWFMPEEDVHNQIAIAADHSSLVKFTGRAGPNYLEVRQKLRELVKKVPEILLDRENNSTLNVATISYFMIPFSKNEQYIGRSQKLACIKDKLVGGGNRRLALWGMGGVGKTQDVLEYIYEFKGSAISVFWIHAGSTMNFEQDYRKLAGLVGLPGQDDPKQDIRPAVKHWLEGPESADWILVLDNADNILDFFSQDIDNGESINGTEITRTEGLAEFIPRGTKGTVIVTTRNYELAGNLADVDVLHKEKMSPGEAMQLFTKQCPTARDFKQDSAISLLLEELHYLPLAIVQAAKYLRHNQVISPSRYLELFQKTEKELLSIPFSDPHRYANRETVIATFSITYRQVREQSPLAFSLLKLMACIDRQNIPHELLESSLSDEFEDEAMICEDEISRSEAISKLINLSLLTAVERGTAYEMHSLVHASLDAFLSSIQEMDATVEWSLRILNGILPNGEFENWTTWNLYLPHAVALTSKVKTESLNSATILYNMSWYLELIGRFSEAEHAAQRSVTARISLLGQEHTDTSNSISNLASTYRNQGRWKEAEVLEVQVMETRKRVLGQEHPSTLTSMANLASTYRNQGRWKEAEVLEVQVMETRKRVLGQEHPDTLTSMANLASTYRNQGRWKEAEVLEVQVMETRKRVLGQEHPDTLTSMANLASTYRSQGRWKEAEVLEVQVMKTRKRVLGQEHPDTLTSMANLASTYRNQGRWKEAEVLDVQVMETRKRVLGQEHPDTLTSMANLASTYRNQGRWKEAEDLDVQVMETSLRVLGQEHPSTLTSMANLASTFWNQGRWKETEELDVQVMETRKRVLGQEHPDTLTSMANLASTYRNQGRWKGAEVLEVQVMETRKRALGQEHPDTLTSIANLASTYRNQGRWKEAEVLEVQVMETSLRVLGQEHPDTLTSMANLASTFWNQGRWKEAEVLEVQVMETRKRMLGQEHPSTLTSIANLASTFWNQGRWKEAEDLDVQVMETRKRVLGQEHPDTLTSMANLASTYRSQGRWKEAEVLEVRVMETSLRVLGQEHPSTLTSMANLASTFWNQGRWKGVEDLDVQVMETRKRVLGQEHPDTLTSMANLASTFWNQGRWKEAEELDVQVMETRKRVLGQEHPDTLSSMANLAYTHKSQSRNDVATAMMEQVVALRSRILGDVHPDTKSAEKALAKWKQEEYEETDDDDDDDDDDDGLIAEFSDILFCRLDPT
ncbi:hypothetical protein BDD12DRAFT_895849 [Trichophaea hybrida]|nr:hypothetical protein BDD12DRAFT_895849 [Trichophaea hybrida]